MTERRPPAQLFLPARWRAVLVGTGLGVLLLLAVAALNARSARGRPFPGLLTDPWGSFSAVYWPSWGPPPPLRFPDQLIAVDGETIVPDGRTGAAARAAARLADLYRSGRHDVSLTFRTPGGPVTIMRPLRTLGVDEALFFFAIYALTGLFVLWSSVVVLALARRRPGAIAYGWWSAGTFVFLTCFYDYHTTTKLVPLFAVSTVWVQIAVIRLAYWFPVPPIRHRRALRAAVRALTAAGVAAATALLIGSRAGFDVAPLRVCVAHAALGSLLVLPVTILLRLKLGPLETRREVRAAAWGMAVVPVLLALGFVVAAATGIGIVHILLPFLAPLVPLSIGYSLIRNNILGIRALLDRRILLIPIASGAASIAILVWLGVHALLRHHDVIAFVPWAASLASLLIFSAAGRRLSNQIFFPARAKFRPTIQQLADDLASKRDAASIDRLIAASVVKWLPTEDARVVHADELHQIHQIPHLSIAYRESLTAGQSSWTTEPPSSRHLLLPMRSQGELQAVLLLGPKRHKALYTREDLDLLETIASLGAVALHNAAVIAERESLRRFEIDAARDDKRLTLGLLGAEIAHEIAYPLNYLRYLLGQGSAGRALDTQDVEIAREEIGRLERMFSGLRRLRIPLPRLEPVLVLPRARRALDLIREIILAKEIEATVDLPADLTVYAEPDPLVQIFANLLRNAAQAVAPRERIGIGWQPAGEGIAIDIWDSGAGPAEELRDRLFNPFVTDKEGSMGLGLAVTARLISSFGWTISVLRREGRTVFRIDVPDRNGGPGRGESPS